MMPQNNKSMLWNRRAFDKLQFVEWRSCSGSVGKLKFVGQQTLCRHSLKKRCA
jgi:hypothetical protein